LNAPENTLMMRIPKQNFDKDENIQDYYYSVPSKPNFPDVDAIVKNVAVFQMTINPSHPFTATRAAKLIEGWMNPEDIPFIYVVPEDIFEVFKYQTPVYKNNEPVAKKQKTDQFKQYALCIDMNELEESFYRM
jgi:hypothetical protein